MTAKEMFKYANYDLIVEENGSLKYVKKDGLGNQEVIKFIVGGFQVINVYWEKTTGPQQRVHNNGSTTTGPQQRVHNKW
jgi:hypothetical protein